MKRKKKDTEHHRKCRSNGGTDEKRNISIVTDVQHRAYHALFSNKLPHEVADILNRVWIDPDYALVCKRRRNGHQTE